MMDRYNLWVLCCIRRKSSRKHFVSNQKC